MKKLILSVAVFIAAVNVYGQHKVTMRSGESMNGEVKSMANSEVSFLYKGNTMKLKTEEIKTIDFDAPAKVNETAKPGDAGKLIRYTYDIPGRKVVKEPEVTNLKQEHGKVVLSVVIDKYGNVVRAEPGAPGTNTKSTYLHTKAKQAAEGVKFDTTPTTPLETKGTITIEL